MAAAIKASLLILCDDVDPLVERSADHNKRIYWLTKPFDEKMLLFGIHHLSNNCGTHDERGVGTVK